MCYHCSGDTQKDITTHTLLFKSMDAMMLPSHNLLADFEEFNNIPGEVLILHPFTGHNRLPTKLLCLKKQNHSLIKPINENKMQIKRKYAITCIHKNGS